MINRKFEKYKGGKLIGSTNLDIRTTWEDLTLKQFIAYLEIVNILEEYNDRVKAGEIEESNEEIEVKRMGFFADMVMVLTGLPKAIVYTMSPNAIVTLWKELDFKQDKLPEGTLSEFWFRSASEKKISIEENYIKTTKWFGKSKKGKNKGRFNAEEKIKCLAELELMKKSHFTLRGNVDSMDLEHWMHARKTIAEIKKIQGRMQAGHFEGYALLIAYICLKNGNQLNIKECKKLGVVFEDLPFCTAYKIVNFFLNVRSVLSERMQKYLTTMAVTIETSQKHKQKSNT